MEWLTHGATAVAAAGTALLTFWFWAWRQRNSIQTQQKKDAYDMEKLRRSDFGKELLSIIDELKSEVVRHQKKIEELHVENLACARKSAMQDVELYKQSGIIGFLEQRVKSLEELAIPATTAAAAVAAAATALVVAASGSAEHLKEKASQVASALEQTAKVTADASPPNLVMAALGIIKDSAEKIERLKIHDQRNIEQLAINKAAIEDLKKNTLGLKQPATLTKFDVPLEG